MKLATAVPAAALTAALAFVPGASAQVAPPGATNNVFEPQSTRVGSAAELVAVLRSPFQGRVIVPRDVNWEMKQPCGGRDELGRCFDTPFTYIPIHSGVQLVGERGALGSRPVLRATYKAEAYPLFVIAANDVTIEGLHFQGPARGRGIKGQEKVTALQVVEDPVLDVGHRVLIADSELDQWTDAGVSVTGTVKALDPGEYLGRRFGRADAPELVRIERSYLHHNARAEAGYGVVVGGNAYATLVGNVFDFNRHDVTSDGLAYNGYIARFNYALQGGFTYGDNGYYGQHFDVHGIGTPEERAKGHYDGGRAGEYYEIAFNTIRGEQTYGGFLGFAKSTRAAFELRGRPTEGAHFTGNVVVHDDRGEAVRLKRGQDGRLDADLPASFNLDAGGNRFDTDYSTELATGDFDADGRSDVFVANGTAWFFSRAGIGPWEFLRASDKRIRELGFADVTGDAVTDVLYRDPGGQLGYVKSGTAAPLTPLTTSPVPIGELRFGDFDGDRLTDIFFTRRGRWNVWYGRTRAWTAVGSSSQPLSELLFGEFDGVRGTDVATVLRRDWSYSSAATQGWAKLNGKLAGSFAKAVAADFDGNGKSDIAFADGEKWRFSRDGRERMVGLRSGSSSLPYGPLKELLIARFDGGARAMVVTFERRRVLPPTGGGQVRFVPGERFVVWRGLGSGNDFKPRSRQNMR